MKFKISFILSFLISLNLSWADGKDYYYAQSDLWIRLGGFQAKVGVSPVPTSSGEYNSVFLDLLLNTSTGIPDFRLMFVDESNQVVNTVYIPDLSGGGMEERHLEVSPTGFSAVQVEYPGNYLCTGDSGASWSYLSLPTSSTHTKITSLTQGRVNPAKYDHLGGLNIIYLTEKPGVGNTDKYQVNWALYDKCSLTKHTVVTTQDALGARFVDVTQTNDKIVAITLPGMDWVDSSGSVFTHIPMAIVIDPVSSSIVEQTSIGTFPTHPDEFLINFFMHQGENYVTNILTSDGQGIYTLTRTSNYTDSFSERSDDMLIRHDYNSTTGFFVDHGSATGTSPICDLTQLPSFLLHNIMDRTISDRWEGTVFHMAAKRFAAGQSPTLELDLAYLTADDFENSYTEFKRVRITDPNNGGTNILFEKSINDLDCTVGHTGIAGCSTFWDHISGSMSGVEGFVVGSYFQFVITRKSFSAGLFGVDIF